MTENTDVKIIMSFDQLPREELVEDLPRTSLCGGCHAVVCVEVAHLDKGVYEEAVDLPRKKKDCSSDECMPCNRLCEGEWCFEGRRAVDSVEVLVNALQSTL